MESGIRESVESPLRRWERLVLDMWDYCKISGIMPLLAYCMDALVMNGPLEI